MRNKIIAIAASVILLPSLAMAGNHHKDKNESAQHQQVNFNGPVELTSLATLQEMTIGEQKAIVEGTIVRQIADGNFMFSDGTNEVVIDLDDDIRLDQGINEQTRLRLFGEYEAWDKEFEVDRVQVL